MQKSDFLRMDQYYKLVQFGALDFTVFDIHAAVVSGFHFPGAALA